MESLYSFPSKSVAFSCVSQIHDVPLIWKMKWCWMHPCINDAQQQVKRALKRILPPAVVDQSLEHLTSITGVMSSIPLWNSENLFRGFFTHCQEKVTNVDIDKANKAALVGAQDNLLTTLHLLYKYCPSFSKTKYRMHWNRAGTV